MNLADLLSELARGRPHAIALVDERARRRALRRLTFAELETEVARAAGWLKARGFTSGDAVLVFVPMSAELYIALLAMFRLGVVALFLDPSAGRDHLDRCCARWAPKGLLAIPKAHLLRLRSSALRCIPEKFSIGPWLPGARRWLGGGEPVSVFDSGAREEDPALVTFTSGSTGVPKGAVRTHGFLLAQYRALAPNIDLVGGEIDLATLPIFTLANLAAGVTSVMPAVDLKRPGEVDAATLFDQIERERVSRLTASPAFFEQLVAFSRATGKTLPSVTKIHTGGGPVFPQLLTALGRLAPNAQVVAVYGSTEAEPIAHVSAHDMGDEELQTMRTGRGLLAGRPVSEIRVRILPDCWGMARDPMTPEELNTTALPPNNPGEIVVAGAHVLSGYLGGAGDAENKFKVGAEVWHRTGDAGLFDERGRLWLLGRCSARIDDEHGRLYPFGVECAAMAFPEVKRAAVVNHRGERRLIVEAETSARELPDRVLDGVKWAHIHSVHVVSKIPVDPRHNAKIDYGELKKLVASLAQ